MKNNKVTEALNALKMLDNLSKSPCAGCILNKLGTCAVPELSCKEKEWYISHEDFANMIKEDLKNWNNSFCSHLYDELHNYILNLKENKK